MVVPHKDNQKWNKSAIDTWSIREIVTTVKIRESKLQAGEPARL